MDIIWYSDDEIAILFDKVPNVTMRYVTPFTTEEEKKEINKKPFINLSELKVILQDKIEQETYEFVIEKNYTWDGMTIPRFAWTLIGVSKESNSGMLASMLHDYLTTYKDVIDNNRALSTDVFNAMLKVGKVNPVRRFFMKNSVALFQTLFCRW